MNETQLQRMQWAVRATLTLGVAASVIANILHAQPNPISQTIAAWPPLALLITVELVTRIPVHSRWLGAIRIVAASAIAAIAAWISYHHMVGVVARYGETGTVPYLLPVSVDGLILVASVSLVELAARRRESERPPSPAGGKPQAAQTAASAASTEASLAPSQMAANAPPIAVKPNDASKLPDRMRPSSERDIEQRGLNEIADEYCSVAHRDNRGSGGSQDDHALQTGTGDEDQPDDDPAASTNLAPELVPLLPAARAARDELTREGRTVSRDALARRLRRDGHSIRNSGVSELLAALRREVRPINGSRPTASL